MTNTTTTTHTPATLAALPPRELDALAHKTILPDKNTMWTSPNKFFYTTRTGADWGAYPEYSTDLNHAALLEAELARRGLDVRRAEILSELVDGEPIEWPEYRDQFAKVDYAALSRNQRASAKQRTIAAILAAQETR